MTKTSAGLLSFDLCFHHGLPKLVMALVHSSHQRIDTPMFVGQVALSGGQCQKASEKYYAK